MSSIDEANDFLLSGGVAAAKFETVGATVTGRILHAEVQQQREIDTGKPKFWDDGSKREQIVVQLETSLRDPEVPDDDGRRSLYIRGNMLKALRVALKRANPQKLEIGGTLTITYTGDGEQKNRGFSPPKLYTVQYVPAAQAAVADMLGEPPASPEPVAPQSDVLATLTAEQRQAVSALTGGQLPPY
jgi:hypothetical protein